MVFTIRFAEPTEPNRGGPKRFVLASDTRSARGVVDGECLDESARDVR
jgi:hypothetical protein